MSLLGQTKYPLEVMAKKDGHTVTARFVRVASFLDLGHTVGAPLGTIRLTGPDIDVTLGMNRPLVSHIPIADASLLVELNSRDLHHQLGCEIAAQSNRWIDDDLLQTLIEEVRLEYLLEYLD